MNCRPGDLAIVVKSNAGNEGVLLDVIRQAEIGSWLCIALTEGVGTIRRFMPGDQVICTDSCLRPLRDNDGQDETLTWAGLPNKQEQPA